MPLWPPSPCPACGVRPRGAEGLCAGCWTRIDAEPGLITPTLLALGPYRGPLGAALRALKYHPSERIARALGVRLALRLAIGWPTLERAIVVPLPGDAGRLRRRGFDHSRALARALVEAVNTASPRVLLQLQLRPMLSRNRSTKAQSLIGRDERERNVAHSMRASTAGHEEAAEVLILDDILTSGASAREAQRALAAAGWQHVRMVAVAAAQGFAKGMPSSPSGQPVSAPTMAPTSTWG